MKKLFALFTFAICLVYLSNAQQLVSKKGIPILPQKGDIAIGVSATPFLDFVGNVTKVNSTAAFSSPAAWDFIDPSKMYIYGKYFLTDNLAARCKIRIGLNTQTQNAFSVKSGTSGSNTEYVEDKWTQKSTNIILAAGLEKRRGYGRLQGFYGVEAMISLLGGTTHSYEYGNEISSTYLTPTRTNFNGNVIGGGVYTTEKSVGTIFGIGASAFIGAEYFFAPKMSIGGEFGWGIGINQGSGVTGNGQTTYEYWDSGSVKSKTVDTGGKVTNFSIDTKTTSGQIFVIFHY